MIVREVVKDPSLLDHFDWFNDYKDTRSFLSSYHPEVLPQFYATYLNSGSKWGLDDEAKHFISKALLGEFTDGIKKLRDERDELASTLADFYASTTGRPKACGHDFDCTCPGDAASALLKRLNLLETNTKHHV